ncbi:hypothetical protein OIU77_027525 [Salix suchowensis]|uniref:P-type ATPase A domain-containing protein n=1 Tax=Salix suchowensis TaxID=1278906 RepID=A0ABQ9BPZ7_9ROSI|nr:hypothetical protein OIU77_027525 [Salix suchowensis]
MDNTANALEAISKETVDLENVPVEEVFERLKCTKEGALSDDDVKKRLGLFGYSKLEEKKLLWFGLHQKQRFDGKWREEDDAALVPGDIIRIKLGDIIPADARLLKGDALKFIKCLTI